MPHLREDLARQNDGTSKDAQCHREHYFICPHCILSNLRPGNMVDGDSNTTCDYCGGKVRLDMKLQEVPSE